MTKHIFLAGFAMLFFSCTSDDSDPAVAESADAILNHFTVEIITNDANATRYFTTENLRDQKFFSGTTETFVNGIGQGQTTTQHYFYENGLLKKRDYGDDVRDFFYDAQGNMIALNWERPQYNFTGYYRFVAVSETVHYFEKLTLSHDNPAAEIQSRIIVELDANDNVIKAGYDNDRNGVLNHGFYQYAYDDQDNLIGITSDSGVHTAIAYDTIKDNMARLAINTYGKRNFLIYQAECYALKLLDGLKHSPYLTTADLQGAVIESGPSSYYFRKTENFLSGEVESTKITTFYFN